MIKNLKIKLNTEQNEEKYKSLRSQAVRYLQQESLLKSYQNSILKQQEQSQQQEKLKQEQLLQDGKYNNIKQLQASQPQQKFFTNRTLSMNELDFFKPFKQERNGLGQLISPNSSVILSHHNHHQIEKISSRKLLKVIKSVPPSPEKQLIQKGNYIFYDKGKQNLKQKIKKLYNQSQPDIILNIQHLIQSQHSLDQENLYQKHTLPNDSQNSNISKNLSYNNSRIALNNYDHIKNTISNKSTNAQKSQKTHTLHTENLYETIKQNKENNNINNKSISLNNSIAQEKWHYNLTEQEQNMNTQNLLTRPEKLPKLKVYNCTDANVVGPGFYSLNYNQTLKHVPGLNFREKKNQNTQQQVITSDINFLPIYERSKVVIQREGYEKQYNKMMKEIGFKVKKEQKMNKRNPLHPNSHLEQHHFDEEFVQQFDHEFRAKIKQAKKIANKIKFKIKTNEIE